MCITFRSSGKWGLVTADIWSFFMSSFDLCPSKVPSPRIPLIAALGSKEMKKLLILIIIGCAIFLSGCRIDVDPEFLPAHQVERMVTQQFYYSIYIGGFAALMFAIGLYFLNFGNWLGIFPLFVGAFLIWKTNFEVISTRRTPSLSEEIESIPEKITRDFPSLDPLVSKYLIESILSIKHGIVRGAAISLGAASERLVDELISSFSYSIKDEKARESFLSRTNGKNVSRRYEEFIKSFNGMKNRPSDAWAKELNVEIDQMFHYLRMIRNEAAHPFTESRVEREMVISQFGHFYKYAGTIYRLIQFFRENETIL